MKTFKDEQKKNYTQTRKKKEIALWFCSSRKNGVKEKKRYEECFNCYEGMILHYPRRYKVNENLD